MAVAFDNITTVDGGGSVNSFSFSHTTSGNSRYLVVFVHQGASTHTVTNISYGGSNLTFIRSFSVQSSSRVEAWGLANPALGTNTVSGNLSNYAASPKISAISLTGAKQNGQPNISASATGTVQIGFSNQPSVSLSTTADGCMILDAVLVFGNITSLTEGSGQTGIIDTSSSTSWVGGSYESQTSAGSVTMDWTGAGQLNSWGILAVAIAPLATLTQDNSVKASIVVNHADSSSVKANIRDTISRANSAKANIKTTYYCGATWDWNLSTDSPGGQNRGYNS